MTNRKQSGLLGNAFESPLARAERAVVKQALYITKYLDNAHICVRRDPAMSKLQALGDRLLAARARKGKKR